jgi:hypothetical protein
MWICAKCGTQAQQIEVCSGCGTLMTLPLQPTKEKRYEFVLIEVEMMDGDPIYSAYGPFESVMAADTWADEFLNHRNYEVALMENPNARQTKTG